MKLFNCKKKYYLSILIGTLSLVIGAYFGEDVLGGAKHDYLFHEKYILSFNENFFQSFENFGETFEVRNSPIFFIIFSLFLKSGITINYLKYFNILIIIILIIFFNKSIKLKFKKVDYTTLIFLNSIIFISPMIRSITAWPYPILWSISFFVISNYYFLKFKDCKIKKKCFRYSIKNILFLAISAYLTPNFSVFAFFYSYFFFKRFILTKYSLQIILTNFILALPAILFLIKKDFYIFRHEALGVLSNYSISDTLNISNKIIILTSIIFFFIIPIIDIKKIKITKFININIYMFIFIFINIVFFNFSSGLGGGFFYHLSNLLFKGQWFLFIIFIIAILSFKFFNFINFENIFLFIILIIYNLQSTIYVKYYDPLLFFMFLFLFKINIEIKKISRKYFYFYIIFYILIFSKKFIIY